LGFCLWLSKQTHSRLFSSRLYCRYRNHTGSCSQRSSRTI